MSIHKHKLVLYSPHVFPIYEFDTMARGGDGDNPMIEVNHRVWSIYAIFGVGTSANSRQATNAREEQGESSTTHALARHAMCASAAQICYVWGVFALFFLTPTTVGLCVSSLALTGIMLLTCELMHRASARLERLADAIDYLDEGSDDYRSVLAQCKWIATRNQLIQHSAPFTSNKQNKLVSEAAAHMTRCDSSPPFAHLLSLLCSSVCCRDWM